ncbi:phosphoserine phosphatase SerB [Micropruina sp.]|uniref:phosphoserine phosphatase SerB n=1 Tax=Micropruina sp. TaxID=2737536 RepID=UPI00261077D0|nr:phosphoserine phosphatase SerB [Micropruina sp.]
MSDATYSLAATITGSDAPGLLDRLMAAVAGSDAEILDLEQTVVRGQLSIGLLVATAPESAMAVADHLAGTCARLGLSVAMSEGVGDNPTRYNRTIVTVLGRPLLTAHLATTARAIADLGGNIDRIRRLSRTPLTTVELWVSKVDAAQLRPALAQAAASAGFDVSVSAAGLARLGRRLVVMDVDSTLIQDEVIDLIAAHAGRQAEVAAITESAMRGELDFAESLRRRVGSLAGLPVGVLDEVRAAVRLTPGARTLVATLRDLGLSIGVVSGGFIEVVAPLAAELGITYARANELEVADGRLTGRIAGPIIDRAAKAATLREWAEAEHLPLARTIAIGDGANDLDMLAAAGLGIAFNAKPAVRASADTSLNVPYLDAVLFLLGLTREEVEAAAALRGAGRAH